MVIRLIVSTDQTVVSIVIASVVFEVRLYMCVVKYFHLNLMRPGHL